MEKKIPGNKDYRINLDGVIKDHSGNEVALPKDGNEVVVQLYGQIMTLPLKKLSLLAWYECGVIDNLIEHLDKIHFVPTSHLLNIKCGYMMVFSEPVYYKSGFRYIPSFTRYAIDESGNLLDTLENRFIIDDHLYCGYSHRYIYNADKGKNRAAKSHRLKALAWLPPNYDFVDRPYINHKNGVRLDNEKGNLEWCSARENVHHALDVGLTTTRVAIKVRNAETGVVDYYVSVSDVIRQLELGAGTSRSSLTAKLPGYLWKKKYEIKSGDDDSPWYYENIDPADFKQGKSIFTFEVTDRQSGKIRSFNSTRRLKEIYALTCGNSKDQVVAKFREKYPHLDLQCTRNATKGPYRVFNLEDNTMATFSSLKDTSEYIGRSKAELQVDLFRKMRYVYDKKWIVVPAETKYDFVNYIDKPDPSKKVEVIDVKTGDSVVYSSINETARKTGLNFKTVAVRMKTGEAYKGKVYRTLGG